MDFHDWAPYYHQILNDFGYDAAKDIESALLLDEILGNRAVCDEAGLKHRLGQKVTVLGAGPSLESSLDGLDRCSTLISAGSATSVLMDKGILPDIIFTDLDGNVGAEVEANRQGALVVVLAHSDNMPLLRRCVPLFKGDLMPTCQCPPIGRLRNFGGFTDGDRAVMAARHFGASHIVLVGFDFYNPRAKPGSEEAVKLRKLSWAKRIIYDLNPSGVSLVPPQPPSAGRR